MYQTKTGNILKVIQGEGLVSGRSEAQLHLINCLEFEQFIKTERQRICIEMSQLWDQILDRLTLKQFERTMGLRLYLDKARTARVVSRNKTVLKLAAQIEALAVELYRLPAETPTRYETAISSK